MYKHINNILLVLAYIVNNMNPLIADGIHPDLLEPIVELEEGLEELNLENDVNMSEIRAFFDIDAEAQIIQENQQEFEQE